MLTDQQLAEIAPKLWARVDKTDACWEVRRGEIDRKGYGIIYHRGSRHLTHRVSYMLAHGPFAAEMCVCHRCDNPPCVRPDHLFLGTREDNIRDMVKKGRHRWEAGVKAASKLPPTCRMGHEFTPENTEWRGDRGRRCRVCLRAKWRRQSARVRVAEVESC